LNTGTYFAVPLQLDIDENHVLPSKHDSAETYDSGTGIGFLLLIETVFLKSETCYALSERRTRTQAVPQLKLLFLFCYMTCIV
jgi:hypothetical protein